MQLLTQILKQINDYVWGLPLICLLLGTGIYFTFKLRLIQLTKLKFFLCINRYIPIHPISNHTDNNKQHHISSSKHF